jgi:hypothetical protein
MNMRSRALRDLWEMVWGGGLILVIFILLVNAADWLMHLPLWLNGMASGLASFYIAGWIIDKP